MLLSILALLVAFEVRAGLLLEPSITAIVSGALPAFGADATAVVLSSATLLFWGCLFARGDFVEVIDTETGSDVVESGEVSFGSSIVSSCFTSHSETSSEGCWVANKSQLHKTTDIDRASGTVNLTTVLLRTSGEWISSDWPVCKLSETSTPRWTGTSLVCREKEASRRPAANALRSPRSVRYPGGGRRDAGCIAR